VVEALREELGELLRILLLVLVETERGDERFGVVDGLLGGLEEGEEDLKLEEGRSLLTSRSANGSALGCMSHIPRRCRYRAASRRRHQRGRAHRGTRPARRKGTRVSAGARRLEQDNFAHLKEAVGVAGSSEVLLVRESQLNTASPEKKRSTHAQADGGVLLAVVGGVDAESRCLGEALEGGDCACERMSELKSAL